MSLNIIFFTLLDIAHFFTLKYILSGNLNEYNLLKNMENQTWKKNIEKTNISILTFYQPLTHFRLSSLSISTENRKTFGELMNSGGIEREHWLERGNYSFLPYSKDERGVIPRVDWYSLSKSIFNWVRNTPLIRLT